MGYDTDNTSGNEILNPSSLIIGSLTDLEIADVKTTAEIGSLFYSSDGVKLNFVKNAGGSEEVTSA